MLTIKQASVLERPKKGSLTPVPFIVGVGRSGTTMFRLMLDAHPELTIPPATNFIPRLIQDYEEASNPGDCFVQVLTSNGKWPDFHIKVEALRQRIAALSPFDIGDALRAFYQLCAERSGKPRWGDKSTKNTTHMSMIQKVLPEAHFIHLIRDGRDVALSRSKWVFKDNSVREAGERWVSKIRKARRQAKELTHYLEIRYEDLVLHTESTLKQVCHFIDLRWDPVMLDYYKESENRLNELQDCIEHDGRFRTAQERRRKHQLLSRPPQKDRIGCWKKELSDTDRQWFESLAGELLQNLGYELSTNGKREAMYGSEEREMKQQACQE
jgi:hypothetical protein